MKLKGTTEVFFYKGNRLVREYKKDNSVTRAVANLLNPSWACDVFSPTTSNLGEQLTPIWRLFGGLLVFNKNNSTSEYIPTAEQFNNFTGNAGGSYSGSNPYRGTFLSDESSITANTCDLWYEFGLDKINGNIKSFSLTSIAGGANGLSQIDEENDTSFFTAFGKSNPGLTKPYAGVGNSEGGGIYSTCFVPYILKENDGVLIGNSGQVYYTASISGNNITIKGFKYGSNLNFTDTVREVESLDDYITNFGGSLEGLGLVTKTFSETITSNVSLCDEYHLVVRDGIVWSCVFASGNFYLISIDLSGDDIVVKYGIAETDLTTISECRCDGNKIYAINGTNLYKITMPEMADVQQTTAVTYDTITLLEEGTPIPWKDTVCIVNNSATTGEEEKRNLYFLNSNNILCQNQMIVKNKCDCPVFGFVDLGDPVIGILSKTSDGTYTSTSINANIPPYLATVNNLSSELWKYSTTTMKVHYSLTMEEEE